MTQSPVGDIPTKPYKMYAAIASAFLTSLISGNTDLPTWAVGVITAVVAAIAVYITPNPKYVAYEVRH